MNAASALRFRGRTRALANPRPAPISHAAPSDDNGVGGCRPETRPDMSLRRAIFWVHLAVGVTAAVVILMLAVTGVILTYEAQLNQWALREYRGDPPAPDVAPLGLDELIARVTGEQHAGLVASVALKRDPREPAVVGLDDGATVHVDRFSGERLGDGNTRARRFLLSVMYWHRWFALEGEYRIIGRTFTAIANLGFLFLLVSGIYLLVAVDRKPRRLETGAVVSPQPQGAGARFQLAQRDRLLVSRSARHHRRQRRHDLLPVGRRPRPSVGGRHATVSDVAATVGVGRAGRPVGHAGPGDPVGRAAGAGHEGRRRDARMANDHDRSSRVDSRPRRGRGRPRDGPPAVEERGPSVRPGNRRAGRARRLSDLQPRLSRSAAGCGLRTPERCMA